MAGLEQHSGVLHTIKAWLYHNYLTDVEGRYVARLRTEKALGVPEICAAATTRGGSDINYDTMVEAVEAFLEEMVYQLADGFAVENEFFSLYPTIGGTFEHADSPVDPTKNKVDFSFRKRAGMREVLEHITIAIQGVAETEAYIAEVQDVATSTSDEQLTIGNAFRVLGRHLKIAGPDASNGLYLVNAASQEAVKITGNLIENHPGRLVALVPQVAAGSYHVRVVTQFSTGNSMLKEPRVIEYATPLAVAALTK